MKSRTHHILRLLFASSLIPLFIGASERHINYEEAKKLELSLEKLPSDSDKIHALDELASYYAYILFDELKADSLSHVAIEIAENDGDTRLILNTYNDHLARSNKYLRIQCPSSFIDRLTKFLEFTNDPYLIWRTNFNISTYYTREYKLDQALAKAYKSLFAAQNVGDEILVAKSDLRIGQCLLDKGQHMEAFRNYMGAVSVAEEFDDTELLIDCYSSLSRFYRLNKIDEKAKHYKERQFEQIEKLEPVDSIALAYVQLEFEEILFSSRNSVGMNNKKLRELIDFAQRHNNEYLKSSIFTSLRSALIEEHKMDELYDLYVIDFPEELESLKEQNYLNYLRIKALLFEHLNELDSSITYFEKAISVVGDYENKALVSKFFTRYGQFWERHSEVENAIETYEIALDYATQSGYIPFALDASTRLEKLNEGKGNFRKAYEYASNNAKLTAEFANIAKADDLLRLEIQNAAELSELALQTERAENAIVLNQQKTTKRYFIIAWAAFLLLAIGLFSRLRYTRKVKRIIENEKNKSDDLLLNILPAQIAEELKSTGKAEAQDFKRVSVLFTDFKNFTGLSELLTAQELVEEINACFEEFDRITTKYGIEKIKTIGDSYMAAGGIPIQSKESVKNTVLASFEMQEFIRKRYLEKKENGEICFLMRVGIHTGPVVAGIVGVKKFQYDLWGDTVNTANRMESCGDVDKVNISKSTYELLKEDPDFSFVERDEVEVKGKGKMKMYFIHKNTIIKEINESSSNPNLSSPSSQQSA